MRIKTDSFVPGLGPGRGRAQVWEPCHTLVPEFLLDSCDFVHLTCPPQCPSVLFSSDFPPWVGAEDMALHVYIISHIGGKKGK